MQERAHPLPIQFPPEILQEFCTRNQIRKLSLFGSVLTDRFRPESDVDILIEFEPGAHPTLITLVRLERELSDLIGRKVDLRMPGDLSRYFRDQVIAVARPQYERL
jgi:uncharacterized protein